MRLKLVATFVFGLALGVFGGLLLAYRGVRVKTNMDAQPPPRTAVLISRGPRWTGNAGSSATELQIDPDCQLANDGCLESTHFTCAQIGCMRKKTGRNFDNDLAWSSYGCDNLPNCMARTCLKAGGGLKDFWQCVTHP